MKQFVFRRHFFACIFCAFILLFFFACSDSDSEAVSAPTPALAAAEKSVPSMRIVVLWDGVDKNKNEETKKTYADITRLHPDGAILSWGQAMAQTINRTKTGIFLPIPLT